MSITRLFDFAHYAVKHFPKEDTLVTKYNGIWTKTSAQEFINKGNKISRGLLKLGIKPGDKIGLISTNNRTEWCIMDLGILQIGAINVPVYPTISVEDYIYIFNNADIKYCFVSDNDLYEKLLQVKPNVESLKGVFTFDEIPGAPNWQEVLDLGEDDDNQQEVEDISNTINEEQLATLIYTSGTTGRPKGVMLTHKNIVSNVNACSPIIMDVTKGLDELKCLSFLPMCHIFERMLFYLYLSNGFSIHFAESIEKIGDNVKEVKPQIMTVVPRLVEKVYDKIVDKGAAAGGLKSKIFFWALSLIENYDPNKPKSFKHKIADKLVFKKWREGLGGNMATLVSGSAALSQRLNRVFQGAGIPILEGYGLTETSPVISVNSFEFMKIGTVGHILPNLDVKIQEDGEITVKGPSITQGYYQDEEKTKEAFTEDGYFKTGDIGHIDAEGFLHITDRKKEMFKTSGGKYVAPQVIENLAKASKFIEQIMVVGDGEKMPCALIQPDFAFAQLWAQRKGLKIGTTYEEISQSQDLKKRIEKDIAILNNSLGKWEQIKKIELTPEIWSIEDGLLTPTMKLKRKAVKEKFFNLYEKLYERA
jgi:long-chain acyl-CoA synthetase